MAKDTENIGASVRTCLLQLAEGSGQSFDLVLTRHAQDGRGHHVESLGDEQASAEHADNRKARRCVRLAIEAEGV